MRILGIDHGTVRMGIAVSDELKMVATPLEFIPAQPIAKLWARLKEIIAEKEVELIVIGLPRNMNGTYGPATEKVEDFIEAMEEQIDTPIKKWDERLTSVQANRFLIEAKVKRKKRKEKVDKTAAALILQNYLDSLI